MGRRTWSGALRAAARAVLVPLGVLLAIAFSASTAAAHLQATVHRDGSWAWLRDTALVLDACAGLALVGVPAALRREVGRRSGIGDVDTMSGDAFEARLAALFAALGFDVRRTRASGDFGADLVLERGGDRAVVQAKRYGGTVGIEAVQQVIGATRYYGAAQALVVTNSTCTPAAAALAAAHGVELVEREALVGLLAAHPVADARPSVVVLLAGEVAGGVALLLYAVGGLLRFSGRVLFVTLRAPAALWRVRR